MKYVLDANIAAKWVLPEPDSAKALALRNERRSNVHIFVAPDIFPVEVGHAFTRAERQGRISQPESANFWADVMMTAPILTPYIPLMLRALALSSQARIGVYDCLYVALAEREACDFVSADDRLVRNIKPYFPFIVSLNSMP